MAAPPFQPRLCDQMLPLIRERFRRCREDPGLGPRLVRQALVRFPSCPGLEAQAGALMARIRADRPRVQHVILVPSRDLWSVVDEACLVAALPAETTLRLYFGPPGRMDASRHYPTYDVGPCLPLVLQLLQALDPASIHVRGSAQFQSQAIGAAIKALLPDLFLTFEVYDYAGMFDDQTLAAWSYSPEAMAENRDAEAFLGLRAEVVIDKTPGRQWTQAAGELFGARRIAYFPALGTRRDPLAPGPRAAGPLRILCAGSLPYFHNYRPGQGFPQWSYQNVIDPIVALSRTGAIHVDIFNASHDPELDHWPAFGGYQGLFDPDRVRYHPRIPVPEVRARMPGYDFGMFYFQASAVPVDYPLQQSLPNRCMSYIAGGLPIVVNREMACMAGLVDRFQAGIVLEATAVGELPGRLRAADLEALRQGAAALRRHLLDCNDEAMRALRTALQGCSRDRPRS